MPKGLRKAFLHVALVSAITCAHCSPQGTLVTAYVPLCTLYTLHSGWLKNFWSQNIVIEGKSDARTIRCLPSLSLGISTCPPSCHLSAGSYESSRPSSECTHLFTHIAHLVAPNEACIISYHLQMIQASQMYHQEYGSHSGHTQEKTAFSVL